MCLLIKLDGAWPSDEILRAGVAQNKDGIGIAFPDGDKVQYFKGITFEQLMTFKEKGVTKGLIHFRMTSSGPTIPQLCHPFPISKRTGLKLEGRVEQVLAHNGHWGKWEDFVWDNLKHAPMPKGAMSDTRAMAWLTGIHGMGFLRILNEKVLVVTPDYIYQFGKGWEPQPKNQGYQLSYNPLNRVRYTYSYADEWEEDYGFGSRFHGNYPHKTGEKGSTLPTLPQVANYKDFASWEEWEAHREAEFKAKQAANRAAIPPVKPPTTTLITSNLPAVIPTASVAEYEKAVAEHVTAQNQSTHASNEEVELVDGDLSFVPETESEAYAG